MTQLKIRDERFAVRASAGYVEIEMPLRPVGRLGFAVPRPDMVCSHRQPVLTVGPGLTVHVSKSVLAGNPYMATADELREWLEVPDHVRAVIDLVVEPADFIAVYSNAVMFIGRAQRLDDELLLRLTALRQAVASVTAGPEPPLDVSMVPSELGAFVRRFEGLAEGDDDRRQELRDRLTKRRRAQFVRAANPLFPALNEYLNTLSEPWPAAAITLSQLGEFAAEILVDEPDLV